jgi:hypothetical protein
MDTVTAITTENGLPMLSRSTGTASVTVTASVTDTDMGTASGMDMDMADITESALRRLTATSSPRLRGACNQLEKGMEKLFV